MTWGQEYVGKYVIVTLEREPRVAQEGILVALDEWGEATILHNGTLRYCWPALEIEEVKK